MSLNKLRRFRSTFAMASTALVLGGAIATVLEGAAFGMDPADSACEVYSLDHPEIPLWSDFTNCPLLQGDFQNERWQVTLGKEDAGVYTYEGGDRNGGDSIYLSSREVLGTEDRPLYLFRDGDTAYTVTFRSNDHNTIRLEVFQGEELILNELLIRI